MAEEIKIKAEEIKIEEKYLMYEKGEYWVCIKVSKKDFDKIGQKNGTLKLLKIY